MDDSWLREMTTKLSGIIFSKALIENKWSKVYESVYFEMISNEFEDEMSFLKIFGECGG